MKTPKMSSDRQLSLSTVKVNDSLFSSIELIEKQQFDYFRKLLQIWPFFYSIFFNILN